MIAAALSRGDVADYVEAVFLVYIVLIFVRVLLAGSADALQPWLRAVSIHQGDDQPVPELLSPLPPADRRRRFRARPQPDPGDHPPASSSRQSSSA